MTNRKRTVGIIIIGISIVGLLINYSLSSTSDGQLTEQFNPQLEAREWLQTNPNPSALASNRFGDSKNALKFVNLLYDKGAVEVFVSNIYDEEWRISEEGGPYADVIIIKMPTDFITRIKLFFIVNCEAIREGFSPEFDHGQKELLLWWD